MIRLIVWDDEDPEDTRFSIITETPGSQIWPLIEYLGEFSGKNKKYWIGVTEGKTRLRLINGGIDEGD